MCVCVSVCTHAHVCLMHVGSHEGQKRLWYPVELEVELAVSSPECRCWEINSDPLPEQHSAYVALPAEPALCPLAKLILSFIIKMYKMVYYKIEE